MSRRFRGVTAWMRASCEIALELSNTRPAWKELEYATTTRAQSASKRHACRRHAGCAAPTEGPSPCWFFQAIAVCSVPHYPRLEGRRTITERLTPWPTPAAWFAAWLASSRSRRPPGIPRTSRCGASVLKGQTWPGRGISLDGVRRDRHCRAAPATPCRVCVRLRAAERFCRFPPLQPRKAGGGEFQYGRPDPLQVRKTAALGCHRSPCAHRAVGGQAPCSRASGKPRNPRAQIRSSPEAGRHRQTARDGSNSASA